MSTTPKIPVDNLKKGVRPILDLYSVHPETTNFWMELSAVSDQQSANTLFLMSFAESLKLMAST